MSTDVRAEGFALSPYQQRICRLQTPEDAAAWRARGRVDLIGRLDPARLDAALTRVVRRHEILRTRFERVGGMQTPVQVILPDDPLRIERVDVGAGVNVGAGVGVGVGVGIDADKRPTPADAPGPRLQLVTHTPDAHALLLDLPALCADSRSLDRFVFELASAYEAAGAPASESTGQEALQYADFAEWQNQALQELAAEAQAFWRQHAPDGDTVDAIPGLAPGGARIRGAFAPRQVSVPIAPALAAQLAALTAVHGWTPDVAVLSAWYMLLWRLGQPRGVVIGVTSEGRHHAQLEEAIGLFAATLPVKLTPRREETFAAWLHRTGLAVQEAETWQPAFAWSLLEPARDAASAPAPYLRFAFERVPRAVTHVAGGVAFTVAARDVCIDRFDLRLRCELDAREPRLSLDYDAGLCTEPAAARTLALLDRLLRSAAADPSQRLARLDLVSPDERRLLVDTWNRTAADYPDTRCVHELFEAQVARTPGRVAVICGDRHLTYRELDARAARLAGRLRAHGVGPDTVVAICAERSIALMAGLLGVLKAGGAYLPLDPAYPPARLRYMLDDSGARVLLVDAMTAESIAGPLARSMAGSVAAPMAAPRLDRAIVRLRIDDDEPCDSAEVEAEAGCAAAADDAAGRDERPADRVLPDGAQAAVDGPPDAASEGTAAPMAATASALVPESARVPEAVPALAPASRPSPDNLAYVIYTSGSSGAPKGTLIPHRGLVNYLAWCLRTYPAAAGSGAFVHSSISFDLTITGLFAPLLAGGTVRLMSGPGGADALGQSLAHERDLGFIKLTPSHLRLIGEQRAGDRLEGLTQALIIGGEQLTADDVADWRARAPATRLFNEYGPTETVVGCCLYEIDARTPHAGAIPIGRPIANTAVYVLDAEMQLAPIGVPGELYIGGAGVARGYLHQPALTARRFVPDPFSAVPGRRLYRTGDLARQDDDGTLRYLGRIDQQVKLGGMRIELEEIETLLARQAGVRAACVRLWTRGARDARLVAYIVPAARAIAASAGRADRTADPAVDPAADPAGARATFIETLRAALAETLPEHMRPASFVLLDALPLTANGKVHREALPDPETDAGVVRPAHVAPRDAVERLLADVWQQALGTRGIGIDDDFFALGGNSLLCFQIIHRLHQAGYRLTLHQIFAHQSIRALAPVLTPIAAAGPELDDAPVDGPVPLTPIQHWFFDQALENPHRFTQAVIVETGVALDPERLREALGHLLAHHDALRARFVRDDAGWHQRIEAAAPIAATTAAASAVSAVDVVTCADSDTDAVANASAGVPAGTVDADAAGSARVSLDEAIRTIQAGIHLTEGPLVRLAILDDGTAAPRTRLLIACHHIAIDTVSWRILVEDLYTACEQLRQNLPVQLSRTTPFARWAQRLVTEARQSSTAAEAPYWLTATAAPGSIGQTGSSGRVGEISGIGEDGERGERGEITEIGAGDSHDASDATDARAVLPCDRDDGPNIVSSTAGVTVALDAVETQALLRDLPSAFGTRINDALLAAVAVAICEWTIRPAVTIDLEGHGRSETVAGVDVSRTIGWFTTLHPVRLSPFGAIGDHANSHDMRPPSPEVIAAAGGDHAGGDDAIDDSTRDAVRAADAGHDGARSVAALRAVGAQLQRVPRGGFGYGLLRYLGADQDVAERLRRAPQAEISFNYVGVLDAPVAAGGVALAVRQSSAAIDGRARRTHLIEIVGGVSNGRLQLHWIYSRHRHHAATIERVAQRVMEVLRALIAEAVRAPRSETILTAAAAVAREASTALTTPALTTPTLATPAIAMSPTFAAANLPAAAAPAAPAAPARVDRLVDRVLVCLQPRGARRPLFLAHPSGGMSTVYSDAIGHMGHERPVYGFQSKGWYPGEEPDTDLLTMTARYVRIMRAAQPAGPYLLAGWSAGAVIAFEMASQLRRLGEEVAFLGLIDQPPPQPDAVWQTDEMLLDSMLGHHLPDFAVRTAQMTADARLAYALEQAKRLRFVPDHSDLAEAQRLLHIFRVTQTAVRAYVPATYDGTAALFRAAQQPADAAWAAEPDFGWGRWIRGGVAVQEIPGHHQNVLEEPRARTLGERLRSALNHAEAWHEEHARRTRLA